MNINLENIVNDLVEREVKDRNIKLLIKSMYNILNYDTSYRRYNFILFLVFILNVSGKKITDFNWDLLCFLHNINLKEQLEEHNLLFEKFKLDNTVRVILTNFNNQVTALGFIHFKELINDFYRLLNLTHKSKDFPNIIEISQYSNLLVSEVRINISKMKKSNEMKGIYKRLTTNFPMGSNYKEMIQHEIINLNFNTKTENEFINKHLTLLLKYFDVKGLNVFDMRIFIFYFVESMGDLIINSFDDISYDLFVNQLNFYKNLEKDLYDKKILNNCNNRIPSLLVQFYRHLILFYQNEYEGNLFPRNVEIVLNSKSIFKIQEEGYEPIYYDPKETPPEKDKYCILPSNYTTFNTHKNNIRWMYVDLTCFHSRYKEDVRKYIWYADGEISQRIFKLHYIKEFLELKINYDLRMENIFDYYCEIGEFNNDFIYEVRLHFEKKYSIPQTLRGCLKAIRKYLQFYKEKYKISNNLMNILSLKGLITFDGGEPLTDNDLNVLYNGFREKESFDKYGWLFTIVFELFSYTNLRIGEILNLERTCLTYYNDEKDIVEIRYLSKESNKEYIYQRISKQIAFLIENAINKTNSFINNELSKKYIFVHPYKRYVNQECIRLDFYKYFKKIQSEKRTMLEKTDYSPYNLRHTFINNVFKEGIKNNLSISEMAVIAGNGYKTANLYYRKYNEIDLYVEAMAKVTITDVDINGRIRKNENYGQASQLVKEGIGNCTENICSFEIGECLICPHFVTFANRIPAFEKLINQFNEEQETTNNEVRIKEIAIEKKLLGKYLSELYKIKKEGGKIN
jgi:hypothetical protein